ncbi:hypothetical protein [Rhizobium sp. BK176]|uniref:hypothetical protein n=1 Tax=Rhizobium sp. BK176 TaxID=2587071 RepID=UPI00216711A1|nr:hypothetical protein [Rhizobium sp. BK176]MCS4088724.1 hypothetical protein [Rhizobium sp. BK176]
MRLNFTYPVIASARTSRSDRIRKAVGTAEASFEVMEFDKAAIEPAFDIGGHSPIVSMGDRLWRKSPLNVNHLSRSIEHLATVTENDVRLIDSEFQDALGQIAAEDRNLLIPKPPLGFSTYLTNKDAMNFLASAGQVARRNVTHLDEADVAAWRARMELFLSHFAVVDGVTYERCHEPLLVVDTGRVKLVDASFYQHQINRVLFDNNGWIQFPEAGLRSDVHLFPADADDEVVRFSEHVIGGDAIVNWFTIDCHGKCSSPATIMELETCRFVMMHAAYFKAADARFHKRVGNIEHGRALNPNGSEFGRWARAVTRAAETVTRHLTDSPCYEEVLQAFDELIPAASRADKQFETHGDRQVWERIEMNTEHLRSRLDDLPIALPVAKNHNPGH